MCGIAGVVELRASGRGAERDLLLRMAAALRHRGPDEAGLYRHARAGLAHVRLSVVDLAQGAQPLASADGTRWIVFNGEIFNHPELRAELERLGHRFRTRSDTEVVLHAYEAWGGAAFARLNGQWALALWDERAGRLLLSRDPLGVHPLYLCEHRGRLYFASEVKALFAADASLPRALDPLGLEQTFTFWSVVPPRSVFRGIEELRPGYTRVYERGAMREAAFAGAAVAGFDGSLDQAVEAVRDALERATRLRMLRADVPVGSYLSGGLDSALIAALARRCAAGRLQTFSLRFDEAEYDEGAYQRLMAGRLGSEHHELRVGRDDIARVFPQVVYHGERPLLRTAPAPMFLLSALVRERGLKVVLTGEGADEMFAGYDLFREAKVRRFWARFPGSALRPRALERLYPYLARSPVSRQALARQFFGRNLSAHRAPGFGHEPRWRGAAALRRMYGPALRDAVAGRDVVAEFLATLPPDFARWSPLAQDQHIEVRTLLGGYLLSSQGDRMLMAHGVEGRFPFLDPEVVALAGALPPAYKLRVLDEKHVLKRAARGLVADRILARAKQPYRAPDALAFTGARRPEYVDELLAAPSLADAGVFEPAAIAQLWRKCRARAHHGALSNADNMALVGALSTQLLHHHYVRQRPHHVRPSALRIDVDRCHERALAPAA